MKIKLLPSPEQAEKLLVMLKRGNQACGAISQFAFDMQLFSRGDIHRAVYYNIKGLCEIPAQLTIRCIAKVVDSYKKKRNIQRQFKPLGAIAFDDLGLRFNLQEESIRIRTLACRERVSYVASEQGHALMQHQKGESDLFTQNGNWYLGCCCEIQEAERQYSTEMMGIDLGITRIATPSDGKKYSGSKIEQVRKRHHKKRAGLQSKSTKSAKRRLKKNSKKEKNFRKDVNHVISKTIVENANRTGRAIVREDLKGIRDRIRVPKALRSKFSGWSFSRLRQITSNKAQRRHACAHIEKANRRSQAEFRCRRCDHEDNADVSAAKNIKLLSEINTAHRRVAGFIRL
ncbi:MAG TPA: transposase [Arachidicoccus sp.]|nr:transposase [Arachidicoccus sp.]